MQDHVKVLESAKDKLLENRRSLAGDIGRASDRGNSGDMREKFVSIQNAIEADQSRDN